MCRMRCAMCSVLCAMCLGISGLGRLSAATAPPRPGTCHLPRLDARHADERSHSQLPQCKTSYHAENVQYEHDAAHFGNTCSTCNTCRSHLAHVAHLQHLPALATHAFMRVRQVRVGDATKWVREESGRILALPAHEQEAARFDLVIIDTTGESLLPFSLLAQTANVYSSSSGTRVGVR